MTRQHERNQIIQCIPLLRQIHKEQPGTFPELWEIYKCHLAQQLLRGYISADEHAAIVGLFERTEKGTPIVNVQPPQLTFGPGAFKMDAPVNDITVRPIIDMTGDREVVRDDAGKITGLRSVERLAS